VKQSATGRAGSASLSLPAAKHVLCCMYGRNLASSHAEDERLPHVMRCGVSAVDVDARRPCRIRRFSGRLCQAPPRSSLLSCRRFLAGETIRCASRRTPIKRPIAVHCQRDVSGVRRMSVIPVGGTG
jgi:hypothetical protein